MGDNQTDRRRARPDLPAALEQEGRDEELERGPEVHPTGMRADNRASVPGTRLPGEAEPTAQEGENERVARGPEGAEPGE